MHTYVRINKYVHTRTYVLLYTCLKITFLWKLKSKIYHLTTDVNVWQFLSRVDNRLCIFFSFLRHGTPVLFILQTEHVLLYFLGFCALFYDAHVSA